MEQSNMPLPFLLAVTIALPGFFGGIVAAIFETFEGQWWPKFCFYFSRALIGCAGAFGAVFLVIALGKFSASDSINNIVYLFSLSLVAGTVGHRLLPKIGDKLENELLKDQIEKVNQTSEDALKKSTNAMEYSSAIVAAETVLSRGGLARDLDQAISRLESIKSTFPIDRPVFVLLGRLYRYAENYDKAILTLREFLENLEKELGGKKPTSQTPSSRLCVDQADAYFNIACYHALKAAGVKGQPRQKHEFDRMVHEALEALKISIELFPKNRDAARGDSDFELLKDMAEFKELVGDEVVALN